MVPEFISLVRACNRYDQHDCPDLWRQSADRLEAMEQAASLLRATSRDGLFVQACVALSALSIVESRDDSSLEAGAANRMAVDALTSIGLACYGEHLAVLADYYMTVTFAYARAA
jgi:hypothetical protein